MLSRFRDIGSNCQNFIGSSQNFGFRYIMTKNDKAFVIKDFSFYFCDILSRFRDIGQTFQNFMGSSPNFGFR